MSETLLPQVAEGETPNPRKLSGRRSASDWAFTSIITTAGVAVLAIMGAVGVFLTLRSVPALRHMGWQFLFGQKWEVSTGTYGVLAVLGFTVVIAVIAVIISVPISLGTALFITDIAPPRFRAFLVSIVDLMAAVPSVVYGLWGLVILMPQVVPVSQWLHTWFGWIPIFRVDNVDPSSPFANTALYSASSFIAGIVVSMMVIPIQTSVMRQVFSQVPPGEREGAYALGSTRWGMITTVAIPFGRSGIIGGTMLGLGRALGETIAVVLIVSPRFDFTAHILEAGSNSISALIANRYAEATELELSALFAAGLVLFALTLVVNFTASYFVARSRSGAGSEA